MKILIVLAHPKSGSFNHAIAGAALKTLKNKGHEVILRDLYAEGFDPLLDNDELPQSGEIPLDIRKHCDDLRFADGIIIVHPNWWGQPPAIMKGWIDRVIRPGVAYRFLDGDGGDGVPVGLLRAKAALVFNTSNTPEAREMDAFGDPLENIWKRCICGFCGVKTFHRRMFRVLVASSPDERAAWLKEVEELCSTTFSH